MTISPHNNRMNSDAVNRAGYAGVGRQENECKWRRRHVRTLVAVITAFIVLLLGSSALSGNYVSDADYATAKKIHLVLERYVKIDIEVYERSYQELVDYGPYEKELFKLSKELGGIRDQIKAENELQMLMARYALALDDAIQALRGICGKLSTVAKHGMSVYPFTEYQKDMREYKDKAEKYQGLGRQLSQYMFGY